jgi:hypothetical protein
VAPSEVFGIEEPKIDDISLAVNDAIVDPAYDLTGAQHSVILHNGRRINVNPVNGSQVTCAATTGHAGNATTEFEFSEIDKVRSVSTPSIPNPP